MLLTTEEIEFMAQKAQWYFDVHPNHINIGGDSYVVTGDGVEDLDRMLGLFAVYPGMRVFADTSRGTPDPRPCDIEDVQAVRARFVVLHGEVNRVPASVRPPSAIEA